MASRFLRVLGRWFGFFARMDYEAFCGKRNRITKEGAGFSRTDVMPDARGDPLRNVPANPPPPAADGEDVVNLLNGTHEPTDDSPTVISRAAPSQAVLRAEDALGDGLRGRRLAHFELIEPIGVGGMAAVLRARDTQLDRFVALKILPPEMASDPENIRRFHQEARSAARLDHENIARVFFCGEDQRLHFIAFEYVEGENLRTVLEKRGRLPIGEALHYLLQVAAGLAHAARRGVVHRDIKPSNIIITPNGRAKLVDMGLARSLEPQHDMGLTQSGVTLGTFDYISPEQALEPRDADVRSDIYSLGCTFYHMLTGQAPVPEGTAAKKLHHHQHVKPTDPRQLVPDLPDEAAVILDRMMAKQVKDRYQTPEQLVHHLYLAARRLGTAADVPEGVLTVEAALPSPPAARPWVLAVMAAIAIVAVIFLTDLSSSTKPEPAPNPPENPHRAVIKKESVGSLPPSTAQLPNEEGGSKPVEKANQATRRALFNMEKPSAADVDGFVQKNKLAQEIILELDDLDLGARNENAPDIVIANPSVIIRSRHAGQRATVRDRYRGGLPQSFQASLIIQSKNCTVENIRFVLDQAGASVPMAILWLQGKGTQQTRIHGCEFIQTNATGEASRMSSVLADSSKAASLEVSESCFLGFSSLALGSSADKEEMVFSGAARGGQDAVTRRGPVRIAVRDCVFGPHASTLRLEGEAAGKEGQVKLEHCSVMAASPSAVYDLADDADARIEADFSLFSHPGDTNMAGMSEGKGAVLLRRASNRGQVRYQGRDNRYHQFDHYLLVGEETEDTSPRLREEIKKSDELRELESSPWKDPQPLKRLEQLAIQAAFEVNPQLSELRLAGKTNGQLIGAERVLSFSYLDKLPTLREGPVAPPSRVLTVEKRAKPDPDKSLYPTLQYALLAAKPGDIIRLKFDGEMKLEPLVLKNKDMMDLTIRAEPGYHPILTLTDTDEVNSPALFDIYNGKLRVEGLEIRLRPSREDAGWCAVVSFVGDGECIFKSCLLTLERTECRTALAVLPDKRLGKQSPRLQLDNCFLRGKGDMLWIKGSHAAEVSIENSLIALSGSLVNVETDKPSDPASQPGTLRLQLRKVTTFLGENLIRLRAAKDITSLAQVRCDPLDCLFLPARERALIRLEGPEGEERGLREKLSWESSGKNAYGSFTPLLEQKSIGDPMKMPPMSNLETWKKDVSGETNSEYNVKLPHPPAADASFARLMPAAFRPMESLKHYGVDLASLTSLPSLRTDAEIPDFDAEFPDN